MSDLISRKAAMNALKEYYCEGCTCYDVKCKSPLSENCPIFNVISTIGAMPAIDAEPVRHERWVPSTVKSHIWYCSGCGERINYNQARRTYKPASKPVHEVNRWCRGCGAKMVEEDDQP